MSDQLLKTYVDLQTGLAAFAERQAERAKDERGQVAAEYIGIIFVISVFILALSQVDIAGPIGDQITKLIKKIGGQ